MNTNDLIFALDIGTRTVIGVVGKQENDAFKIYASEIMEHQSRAMMDGQVHDIEQVAAVANSVKEKLEQKLDIKLTEVAIAAAGRVLKTKQVKVDRKIDPRIEIDTEVIKSLEMEGIQLAQMQLDEELDEDEKTSYYCVGYDIVNYYLNNYVISSLKGHKGKSIGADILATFLPHTVVDSLYTVMNKINLEVTGLTLEPIAAINVAIPKDLRLLNLALIDIGAGTSDIALTKNGSVIAYAMAPVAGDEVTEMLCQHYLIDFNTAEKIKISLSSSDEEISFVDIMGIKQIKKMEEVKAIIRPAVEHLANTIAQKIVEYNQKTPNAVFLVGGGSQITGLSQLIADRLKLPSERVAVRQRNIIQNVIIDSDDLTGPEAITPIGIAVTAQMQKGQDFLSVTVNGKRVRLFNSRKLSVSDALILVGYNPSDLLGKTGKALHFKLNGEDKTLKGEYGKSAEIYVNKKPANLETILSAGDSITIEPAQEGAPAKLTVQDIKEYYANENCIITVNGKLQKDSYSIKNGDVIETKLPEKTAVRSHSTTTRNQQRSIKAAPSGQGQTKNIRSEQPQEQVKPDNSGIIDKHHNQFELEDDLEKFDEPSVVDDFEDDTVIVNKQPYAPPQQVKVKVNGDDVVLSGNKQQYMFVDIFNFIDFDLSQPQGSIVLKLNGRQAAFTDIISNGDEIEIYWAKN